MLKGTLLSLGKSLVVGIHFVNSLSLSTQKKTMNFSIFLSNQSFFETRYSAHKNTGITFINLKY